MKKLLFVLALLFNFSVNAQIQLDDFFKQGASWCESQWMSTGHNVFSGGVYTLNIVKDSFINNLRYHMLDTLGGIRTSNDTVFFYRTATFAIGYHNDLRATVDSFPLNRDTVLYVFGLHVGDKFGARTVVSVDQVQLSNGLFAKRINFDGFYPENWIEGLGSSNGVLGAWKQQFPYATFPMFYNNGAGGTYAWPQGKNLSKGSDCFPTGVSDITEGNIINIYPNPVTGNEITVDTDIKTLSITDIMGKMVYHSEKVKARQRITINIPQGLYVVHVKFPDGRVAMQKLVQQ